MGLEGTVGAGSGRKCGTERPDAERAKMCAVSIGFEAHSQTVIRGQNDVSQNGTAIVAEHFDGGTVEKDRERHGT